MPYFLSALKTSDYIAIILAFIAVATSILLYFRSRRVTRLVYTVSAISPLLTKAHSQIGSTVKVIVNGQPIADPAVMRLSIKNTGNQPIRPSDFTGSITIDFHGAHRLLSLNQAANNVNP